MILNLVVDVSSPEEFVKVNEFISDMNCQVLMSNDLAPLQKSVKKPIRERMIAVLKDGEKLTLGQLKQSCRQFTSDEIDCELACMRDDGLVITEYRIAKNHKKSTIITYVGE